VHGLSSLITGGGHSTFHGALSCTRSAATAPGGITIDAWLAAQPGVRGATPFDAVRLGVSTGSQPLHYQTCAYGKDKPAAILLQPAAAFNALFGSVSDDAGRRAFAKRSRLLGFARSDVEQTLVSFRGNEAERRKLEVYLASIAEVDSRQQLLLLMNDALTAVKPPDPTTNPLLQSGTALDDLAAQFELASAALLGDLTRVVVIAAGTGAAFNLAYPGISSLARHDLHHTSADNPTGQAAIHEVSRRIVALSAKLARTLLSTPEPGADGSMLDHTVIVHMSDNGEQHHSSGSEWPILLLGGGALGLRTGGRSITMPGLGQPGHRQVSNVFNTLGLCAGEVLEDFGAEGPRRVATGPLEELA
jgi:Protein of unknown function (DUF1552)